MCVAPERTPERLKFEKFIFRGWPVASRGRDSVSTLYFEGHRAKPLVGLIRRTPNGRPPISVKPNRFAIALTVINTHIRPPVGRNLDNVPRDDRYDEIPIRPTVTTRCGCVLSGLEARVSFRRDDEPLRQLSDLFCISD